jgi:hypothetical protein
VFVYYPCLVVSWFRTCIFIMALYGDNVYLSVCSKDSATYFPNNKPANFRVKLAQPLQLTGCWKVGLCEIQLCNINIKKKGNASNDNDDTHTPVINGKDIPTISINCNICTGLIVNGVQTRTLRKVWGKKNIYKVFPIVYYVPLEKGYVDTIEFNIRDTDGELVSFDTLYGKVEMTLRLKRS